MKKSMRTRQEILRKAFDLIYRQGYQATSIDRIIETTEVTKGAFYYHFKNKDEMGVAVINEIITPTLNRGILDALRQTNNPIEDIPSIFERKLMNDSPYFVENGCPTNNLVQEMSPVNPLFYRALRQVLNSWIKVIEESLARGQAQGSVKQNIDLAATAKFIVASYEGTKGLGKIYGNAVYQDFIAELQSYLNRLRSA